MNWIYTVVWLLSATPADWKPGRHINPLKWFATWPMTVFAIIANDGFWGRHISKYNTSDLNSPFLSSFTQNIRIPICVSIASDALLTFGVSHAKLTAIGASRLGNENIVLDDWREIRILSAMRTTCSGTSNWISSLPAAANYANNIVGTSKSLSRHN